MIENHKNMAALYIYGRSVKKTDGRFEETEENRKQKII